ncbi:MAG: AAA family ATPase [Eubacteriales bacterium]|nr:AAA family ATPase [Eubacteriales bacterium]
MRNNGIHIRIGDVLYGIIKHRILITALTAAGLLIGIVLSGISYLRGEMSKEYIITSSFSVNTQTHSGLFTSGYDFPNYNDINMAEDMVDAVAYVLKSDKMLKEIIDSLGLLGVTTKDIADNLSLTQYNETQIIEMSLYWRSSKEGITILSEINSTAPEILMETLSIGSVSVINEPSSKYLIGGSINIILWGYMALLGFGLGIGITLLELIMHPTLLNVQDIETAYGLEILCEIADDKAYFDKKKSILVEDDSRSEVGESFASAAHIIRNRLRKKEGPHIIYITSALRNEGKTNMIANLAIQLSDLEKHVLLIDFDMKNPTLGRLFLNKVDYEHSLNALYAGDITEKEAVTNLTGYLDILPTVLERSSIPLDSNLFSVVRKLAEHYDYVLMDTAPVGLTADPMSLNQIASDALFVVRYDTASMQEIKDALERIEKSGISILGCIVNGVQVSERGIKNPVKEKEKIKKAENKARSQAEPLMDLNLEYTENQDGISPESDDSNISSLVAGFAGDSGSETQRETSEVTTSDSFVDLLFQAESNQQNEKDEQDNI